MFTTLFTLFTLFTTYIVEKVSSVHLGNNIPECICLRSFILQNVCSKRSNVLSFWVFTCVHEPAWTSGSQNCWQWCWTQLRLGKESFISKSQQTHLLHLVWWHCWHSSRNSQSEKVRRRTPKRQKFKAKTPERQKPHVLVLVSPLGARPSQAPLAADLFHKEETFKLQRQKDGCWTDFKKFDSRQEGDRDIILLWKVDSRNEDE